MLTYLIILIFSIWFFISAMYQIPKLKKSSFKIYDSFSLIPAWSFFAPNPGTNDYHLLFRDKLENDSLTVWKECNFDKKSFFKAIWNPNKRKSKSLFDLTSSLVDQANKDSNQENIKLIKYSMSYLMILNYLTKKISHSSFSKETQFVIVENYGFIKEENSKILFISEFHKLI